MEIQYMRHWIDWTVVGAVLIFFIYMAYRTKVYTKSTADFLAANRKAGRYMLTMAFGMAFFGAASIIGSWERRYDAGFGAGWWSQLNIPVGLFISLTGYVIYRYRETRALTLGQFLETRYSRNFRVFAAMVCFVSGLVNFGIFPKIGANFFMRYCQLPETYGMLPVAESLGAIFPSIAAGIPLSTHFAIMVGLVLVALYFTLIGGQVAVLVTDFLQSFFCYIIIGAVMIMMLIKFPIGDIFESLRSTDIGGGKSMLDPLDAGNKTFGHAYFFISVIMLLYTHLAWQGSQAYNASAKSPHEAKMSAILGGYRLLVMTYGFALIPLVAYMIMHSPDYSAQAASVMAALEKIPADDRGSMLVPMTMTLYMPIGLMGAFAAVMMAAFITTNDTYLHSWGSIFIQDIIMPFRKKPFTPKQHMWLLRIAIIGVAIFILCWSAFVPLKMPIWMYFPLTGSIWLGGAGIVIVGGLYSSWGTTKAAFGALIVGAVASILGGVALYTDTWQDCFGYQFPFDGQKVSLIAALSATSTYCTISLFGRPCRSIGTAAKAAIVVGAVYAFGAFVISDNDIFGTAFEPTTKWRILVTCGAAWVIYLLTVTFLKRRINIASARGMGLLAAAAMFAPVAIMGGGVTEFAGKTFTFGLYSKLAWTGSIAALTFLGMIFLGRRHLFNMDKMLHRGQYAVKEDRPQINKQPSKLMKLLRLQNLTREFTKSDKIIYAFSVVKGNIILILFAVMTILAFTVGLTEDEWLPFHKYKFLFHLAMTLIVIVWLSIGGMRDLVNLFRDMKAADRDDSDDGRVTDHDYEQDVEKSTETETKQD